MIKNKKEKYLYFDTTCRNPLRLKHFLKIIEQHDGKILTNNLCVEIVKDLIKNKIFTPKNSLEILDNEILTKKFKSIEEEDVTEEEARQIISCWVPHAGGFQAGFKGSKKDPSWASRFFKYYEECRTFGLIYFVAPGSNAGKSRNEDAFAEKFYITDLGKKLISSIDDDDWLNPSSSAEEEIVWASIIAKYQSNNPFCLRLQSMCPFPLFMKVLIELKKIPDIKQKIYMREIPIFLLWPNNDWKTLIEFLLKFRSEVSYNKNSYFIEDYILKEIGASKSWTSKGSLNSARDKFYRLLGASGLFERSIWTIGISPSREDLIRYIANNYLDTRDDLADDEMGYFSYASKIDSDILKFERKQTTLDSSQLNIISSKLKNDEIISELIKASKGERSGLPQIRDVKGFVVYEYFCALLIHKNFKNTTVVANTKTDSFGWPIGHASGSRGTGADIECFEKDFASIVEPSLDQSGAGQIRELYSIREHREHFIDQNNLDDAKIFFISPKIHRHLYKFSADTAIVEQKPIILNLTTNEFIDHLQSQNSLKEVFNL